MVRPSNEDIKKGWERLVLKGKGYHLVKDET